MAKHRVLIVGVGSIGERHLRCFTVTGRAQTAICEVNTALREKVAKQYNVGQAYSNLEAALADVHDVAVVCTPAHLHVVMTTQLAEAGINVLCEKPLSTSMDGVEQMLHAIAQRDLTAAVGYTWRCNPVVADSRRAIASGQFGQPLQIVMVQGSPFDYHRPAYRKIYYNDHATGGGCIQDGMTHIVNMGEWLVGPIDRLIADCAHQHLEGVVVEDTVHVITRQGNVLGNYSLNQYQPNDEMIINVVCEKASLKILPRECCWQWKQHPEDAWQEKTFNKIERDTLYITQANYFLDAVEGKGKVTCTLEEGLQTLRVNLAMLTSTRQQTWQTIDR